MPTTLARFALIALACVISALASADTPKQITVPAGDLLPALESISKQTDVELVFQPEQLKGLRTKGVNGVFSLQDAVKKLLEGTQLELRTDETTGAMMIGAAESRAAARTTSLIQLAENQPAQQSEGKINSERPSKDSRNEELGEVVVTGSHVRGAEGSSPIISISQEDMRLAGQHTLGDVALSLPQNFNGGQNPGVTGSSAASRSSSNQNLTGASSFNLRGLGPDATLTLLNGGRMPYDGFFQATDVAVIPVAAIDRVEILLDGASAVYGSDAVGGVVNVLLRRDYEGAEVSARFGGTQQGGYEQTQYSGVWGTRWNSGGILATADYSHNSDITVNQRDYLSYIPLTEATIYPASTQKGGLISIFQQIGDHVELSLDAFRTRRDQDTAFGSLTTVVAEDLQSSIWNVAPAVRVSFPAGWSAKLSAAQGENENESTQSQYLRSTGEQLYVGRICWCNKAEAAALELEGPLSKSAAGEIRASLGGGWRKNEYDSRDLITGLSDTQGSDQSQYIFGEVNMPLASRDRALGPIEKLSVNAAVRHEEYDSFGTTTTPKFGIVWGITPSLDFKASWGKSFKVPTLRQQYESNLLLLYTPELMGISQPSLPAGTLLLRTFGGNPELKPERAEILTAGLVFRPEFVAGLAVELGWFDIDYTDRIGNPILPLSSALVDPAFASFVTLNPSDALQAALLAKANQFYNLTDLAYDTAAVYAVINDKYANATTHEVSGVDLSVRHSFAMNANRFALTANMNWIDGDRRLTPLSAPQNIAGDIHLPAKFRGRLGANWSRGALTVASYLNYVDGVKDTNSTPQIDGGSSSTVDLVVDYGINLGRLRGFRINAAVTNLFDRDPPYLRPASIYQVNYDTTNYSAIGRSASLTLTKAF